jgi:hypothetical protein
VQNATAAANVSTQGGGLLSSIVGALSRGPSGELWPAIVVAAVGLTIIVPLLYVAIRWLLAGSVGQPLVRQPAFIVYDSSVPAFRFYVLTEIAPNVFASRDGKFVALVSENSRMVDITNLPFDKKARKYTKAYYVYRVGSLLLNIDPFEEFTLSVLNNKGRVRRLSDLLVQLYNDNVVGDIVVSPAVRLALSVDPEKAGTILVQSYGKHAEEALISIVGLTGRRKEFEQHLRTILELEQKRLESISGTAIKIALVVVLVAVAIIGALGIFGKYLPGAG